jgi:hypothetical protein
MFSPYAANYLVVNRAPPGSLTIRPAAPLLGLRDGTAQAALAHIARQLGALGPDLLDVDAAGSQVIRNIGMVVVPSLVGHGVQGGERIRRRAGPEDCPSYALPNLINLHHGHPLFDRRSSAQDWSTSRSKSV